MAHPPLIDLRAFSNYARLRRVKEYVEQHLSEELSANKAAEIAGLDTGYFQKFFHDKTGLYYSDWLSSVRVLRAIEMLKTGDEPVSRIASAVGYEDQEAFERVFIRRTSMTPGAFKSFVRPD